MAQQKEFFSPLLRKNPSGTWYIEYYIDLGGVVKRVRLTKSGDGVGINTIKNLKEREAFAKKVLEEYRRKVCRPESAPARTLVREAMDFAVGLKASLKKESNLTYQSHARWFNEYLESRGLSTLRCFELTQSLVQDYFDHMLVKRKVSNTTYNTRKNHLRGLFAELVKRGYFEVNYAASISSRPKGEVKRRAVYASEKEAIFSWAFANDPVLAYAMLLLGYCAVRPGEIRQLRVGHVDLDEGVIHIPGSISKNKRAAGVTIPEDILPALRSMGRHTFPKEYYLFGASGKHSNHKLMPAPKPIGENTLSNRFRAMRRALKEGGVLKNDIPLLQFYSLKDTLALYLLESGVDIDSAMRHFRHSDLSSFQRYLKRLGGVNAPVKALKIDVALPSFEEVKTAEVVTGGKTTERPEAEPSILSDNTFFWKPAGTADARRRSEEIKLEKVADFLRSLGFKVEEKAKKLHGRKQDWEVVFCYSEGRDKVYKKLNIKKAGKAATLQQLRSLYP